MKKKLIVVIILISAVLLLLHLIKHVPLVRDYLDETLQDCEYGSITGQLDCDCLGFKFNVPSSGIPDDPDSVKCIGIIKELRKRGPASIEWEVISS